MANDLNLFYSEEAKKYYWIGSDICAKCNKPIIHVGYLLWDYWTKQFRQFLYCYSCRGEIRKSGGKYTEFKRVFVVPKENMPLNSFGLYPQKPELSSAQNLSVFDVATKIIGGEQVIDNAIACRDHKFMIQADAKKKFQIEDKSNKREVIENDNSN